MVRNQEELKALQKVMRPLFLAQSFELIILDSNIMVRKMVDNEFHSPPFQPIQLLSNASEVIMAVRRSEKRPVVIWDLEDKGNRVEDWLTKIEKLKTEFELLWFLTSNQLDKARVVPLLKSGANGFLAKPWSKETLLEQLSPLFLGEVKDKKS